MRYIFFIITFSIFSSCTDKQKIEKFVNEKVPDNSKCHFFEYSSDDELNCPDYYLFKIETDSSNYLSFCERIKLINIEAKKNHSEALIPYDLNYNNGLWTKIEGIPQNSLPQWWPNFNDTTDIVRNSFAHYYYYSKGNVIIGNKNRFNGRIFARYFKNSIYGMIEIYCKKEPGNMGGES